MLTTSPADKPIRAGVASVPKPPLAFDAASVGRDVVIGGGANLLVLALYLCLDPRAARRAEARADACNRSRFRADLCGEPRLDLSLQGRRKLALALHCRISCELRDSGRVLHIGGA